MLRILSMTGTSSIHSETLHYKRTHASQRPGQSTIANHIDGNVQVSLRLQTILTATLQFSRALVLVYEY